jgi:glycosyltransferase involved in cell wall biosynthesis
MTCATTADLAVAHRPATQRSLRIALVTETYPPEVNGVAATLSMVVEGLRQRRHDLQLIRPRQTADDPAARDDRFHELLTGGLPIPRYSQMRMGVPCTGMLVKAWTRRRPDVVHIATEGPLGWSALRSARRLGLPVTSDFRTNFHAYSRHYGAAWLYRPIMGYLRRFHNDTQCTMVPSEGLRRELAAAGFERLAVVGRGVDTDRFRPELRSDALRSAWGASPQTLVVLCVGRLAQEKNPQTLADAFHAMARVRPDIRLVLVGDGPARVEYERRCPGAVFAGIRTGSDLAAHYASADVFLFPSMTETFGNVVTEAMASGLPVVAYDHAAAGQLLRSGKNGLLAPLNDSESFIAQATVLAAEPALARGAGLRARQTACSQGWDRIVAQVEEVMLDAIHGAVRATPALPHRSEVGRSA